MFKLLSSTVIYQGIPEWTHTISAGNIRSLSIDKGLKSVNLSALKKLWRISYQVNSPDKELFRLNTAFVEYFNNIFLQILFPLKDKHVIQSSLSR